MNKSHLIPVVFLVLIFLNLAACYLPPSSTGDMPDSVAQTKIALALTQTAMAEEQSAEPEVIETEDIKKDVIEEEKNDEATLDFWADSTTIIKGECTTLHWHTSGGGVFLDGQKVTKDGEKMVCPKESEEFHLEIGDKVLSKKIIINVQNGSDQSDSESEQQPTEEKKPTEEQPTETPTEEPLTFSYGPGFDLFTWSLNLFGKEYSFDVNTVVPGKEVTLHLNRAVPVNVYLGGTLTPKKTTDNGKTITITIPSGFQSGYIELIGDGVYAKSSDEIHAWFTSSGLTLKTDLAVTDLYPTNMPVGQIYARITNRGPTKIERTNIDLRCYSLVSPLPGVFAPANPINVVKSYQVTIEHNETIILDTGIPNDTSSFSYNVTCTVEPNEDSYVGYFEGIRMPVWESDTTNNTYNEIIPQ